MLDRAIFQTTQQLNHEVESRDQRTSRDRRTVVRGIHLIQEVINELGDIPINPQNSTPTGKGSALEILSHHLEVTENALSTQVEAQDVLGNTTEAMLLSAKRGAIEYTRDNIQESVGNREVRRDIRRHPTILPEERQPDVTLEDILRRVRDSGMSDNASVMVPWTSSTENPEEVTPPPSPSDSLQVQREHPGEDIPTNSNVVRREMGEEQPPPPPHVQTNPLNASEKRRQIGQMLRDLREESTKSRREVSEQLGITQSVLRQYEVGEKPMTLDIIRDILRALGVNPLENESAFSLLTELYVSPSSHENSEQT